MFGLLGSNGAGKTTTLRMCLVELQKLREAFAASVRALVQALVVLILAALLGVGLTDNPLKLLAMAAAVILGSSFFCCLSITIAGLVLTHDRLMGIGQAITMQLGLDFGVLILASVVMISIASALLGRLAR